MRKTVLSIANSQHFSYYLVRGIGHLKSEQDFKNKIDYKIFTYLLRVTKI